MWIQIIQVREHFHLLVSVELMQKVSQLSSLLLSQEVSRLQFLKSDYLQNFINIFSPWSAVIYKNDLSFPESFYKSWITFLSRFPHVRLFNIPRESSIGLCVLILRVEKKIEISAWNEQRNIKAVLNIPMRTLHFQTAQTSWASSTQIGFHAASTQSILNAIVVYDSLKKIPPTHS